MKSLLVTATALVAASNISGHTLDTAIVAMMKLAEVPSYSWICSINDDAQTYEIEGKTQSDGYTWQRQPMPKTIARRLGRAAGHQLESIFSGPLRYVVQTESGWRTLNELPQQHSDWTQDEWLYIAVPPTRTADMSADETDTFGLPASVYLPVLKQQQEEDKGKIYSNAQFALSLPHEELAVIVSSHATFEISGDTVSGTLTDIGAQLLLVHDGHEYIVPVFAGGRFKLWLKGGVVEKYTVELAGIVVVERKPIYVRQKATTVVKDIGKTRLDVPADARRKLGAINVAAAQIRRAK
jgi:hypothetical protein